MGKASNQSAELTAAIEAIKIAKQEGLVEFKLVTDSKYVFNGEKWSKNWVANVWLNHKRKTIDNLELWQDFYNSMQGLKVVFEFV